MSKTLGFFVSWFKFTKHESVWVYRTDISQVNIEQWFSGIECTYAAIPGYLYNVTAEVSLFQDSAREEFVIGRLHRD